MSYQPASKYDFAYPYDSSYGIPEPYFWTAVIILGYRALRFYLSLKRDKKQMAQNANKEKIKKKKKWKPPMKNKSAPFENN